MFEKFIELILANLVSCLVGALILVVKNEYINEV